MRYAALTVCAWTGDITLVEKTQGKTRLGWEGVERNEGKPR